MCFGKGRSVLGLHLFCVCALKETEIVGVCVRVCELCT